MRSLATMRIRSPISYISRTLPLAIRGRSATVGMGRRLSSGSGGLRGGIGARSGVAELPSKRPVSANSMRQSGTREGNRQMAATQPEQMHRVFEEAFNAGDLDALMALYEPDAALVPQPGAVAEGTAAIRDALTWFLDRRGRITLDTKLVLRVGDLAYLANRWSLSGGTMPDGSPAELGATTAEVARRQPDGTWLYVIDNAWGDQAT